ncbi:DUF4232 domain-containing protein [Leifsonia sp. NPDC102414]|uniref:DUF4232 domain-containing protein n=1 Tax=Leifsonia sp. NPDC102414 TaxID=3364124 RepID=UPI00381C4396
MTRTIARRIALLVTVSAAALALAACSNAVHAASPSGTSSCRNNQLVVSQESTKHEGMHKTTIRVAVENKAAKACALPAEPTVEFADKQGAPIGAPSTPEGTAGDVVLGPTRIGVFDILVEDAAAYPDTCDATEAEGLRVFAAADIEPANLSVSSMAACRSDKIQQITVGDLKVDN